MRRVGCKKRTEERDTVKPERSSWTVPRTTCWCGLAVLEVMSRRAHLHASWPELCSAFPVWK